MKKILILILSCRYSSYEFISSEGIEKTWNSVTPPNIETYYYYGGCEKAEHNDKEIHLTSRDDYGFITHKTIECLEYALHNFDFDYIFRTNSSSYIYKEGLNKWLSDKPSNEFYSAVVGDYHGVKFGSGSGYTLSRDLVEKITSNKSKIEMNTFDDVAVGKFLNMEILPAPRKDTGCLTFIDYEVDKHFHWRCKCDQDRRIDVQHMQNIHKLIQG